MQRAASSAGGSGTIQNGLNAGDLSLALAHLRFSQGDFLVVTERLGTQKHRIPTRTDVSPCIK